MTAAPGSRTVPGLAALLAAAGTALFGVPAAVEGPLLFDVSRDHGVTATDVLAAALVLGGLWACSRAAGRAPWAWVTAPGRSFLFVAAVGLGLGSSWLGDEARWVWLLSAALVHLGCRYEEQGGRHEHRSEH